MRKLAAHSDFLAESFHPGYLDSLGLGYTALKKLNPNLIFISITPYGQTGPYKDFKAADITSMAMGGSMYLMGDPDRAPVRISFQQAAFHACVQAVIGALVALHGRQKTHKGQHVDVSIQQAVTWTTQYAHSTKELMGEVIQRAGGMQKGLSLGRGLRVIWPCKDGFVAFRMLGGSFGNKTNRGLLAWMKNEGINDRILNFLGQEDFQIDMLNLETAKKLEQIISEFFLRYTKLELFEEAIRRRIILYPINAMKDIFESPQLKARNFWMEVEHPELDDNLAYPGSFAKLSENLLGFRRRAPLIGEHNKEIYSGELGFSEEQLNLLKEARVI